MKYVNKRTGVTIELRELTEEERRFYERAGREFKRGVYWLEFEELAFGAGSPIYKGKKSDLDVTKQPLYRALEDMWLELGIRQGEVSAERTEKRRGKRRKEKRGGKAANRRNGEKDVRVAASH